MLTPIDFINKMILVGITVEMPDGEIKHIQTSGIVESAEAEYLFLKRSDGSTFCLGFSLEAFSVAKPGTYTEKSTGIEIKNADYLCKWKSIGKAGQADEELLKNGFTGYIKE
jgi:hypothetical protein